MDDLKVKAFNSVYEALKELEPSDRYPVVEAVMVLLQTTKAPIKRGSINGD